MRKIQQKQVLDMLDTLKEAHAEIKRLLSVPGDREKLNGFLAECQNFAVQIGCYIEELEGEGLRTVTLLEDYCDLLGQMSLDYNENQLRPLKEKLKKIIYHVKTELKPNRIEVAFLPYSASMADSLESVWKAALDDPDCDAYIIPIPYFEKGPDGKLGKMHYEGTEFPADIPITDWRKYDLEARHPDIIFIHNPYDNTNTLTSVYPDYFSEKIRKYTDLLVYIPYFVCLNDVQEHFCVLPGTMYADKVILQSETIRNTYLRVFENFEKENHCENRFGNPEKKFIAMGSPKFDKVLNMAREDCFIPEEWIHLLYRPDGKKKKVIFYNTSVAAVLSGNERYLKKLKSVLEFFQNSQDVVLWWRPHPLNEVTYQAMRPQLFHEYELITEVYRRMGYGIYDDTSDLHRAIAMSDAYYGDGSSLVPLFGMAGKPIMIQYSDIVLTDGPFSFPEEIGRIIKLNADDSFYNKFFYNIRESLGCSLGGYVQYVLEAMQSEQAQEYIEKKTALFHRLTVHPDGTSGAAIYDLCKREVI